MFKIDQIKNSIIYGNVLESLKLIPDKSVNSVFTSPPYYNLRDYKVEGQIGAEPTMFEYINNLIDVFAECKRILRDDGTLWLNIGDTYSRGNKTTQVPQTVSKGNMRDHPYKPSACINSGVKEKSFMFVPERLVMRMIDDLGLFLRNKIIWHKPNAIPSSTYDRFGNDWEYVYFFSKSNTTKFYRHSKTDEISVKRPPPDYEWVFHQENDGSEAYKKFLKKIADGNPNYYASQVAHGDIYYRRNRWRAFDYYFDMQYEPYSETGIKRIFANNNLDMRKDDENLSAPHKAQDRFYKRLQMNKFGGNKHAGYEAHSYSGKNWIANPDLKRYKRSVWKISTSQFKGSHFAVFPQRLVEPILLASCPRNGIIVDPFFGTGTVGITALKHGRNFIGLDINLDYCNMARKRIMKEAMIHDVPIWDCRTMLKLSETPLTLDNIDGFGRILEALGRSSDGRSAYTMTALP